MPHLSRKGYRYITIGDKKFLYRVSLRAEHVFLYDSDNKRILVPFSAWGEACSKALATSPVPHRGKHKDGIWSKRFVAALYQDHFNSQAPQ